MEDRDLLAAVSHIVAGEPIMADSYGLHQASLTDDSVVLRSTKCGMIDTYRMLGIDEQTLPDEVVCTMHRWYYWGMTQGLHPRMVMRFTKRLTKGDDCCEWTYKILKPDEVPVAPSR